MPVLRGGYLPGRYTKHPHIFNFLLTDANTIICPSEYLQKSFEDLNLSIEIIPNYINLENYNFKVRNRIKPNLLWVRSIHNIYNPEMAIIVLSKILKKYPEAHLCMVGPEKDHKIMKKLITLINALAIKDHVTFGGKLSKKDWSELSNNYDIFINTTNYDNNPITLLEAMALGMPVVSTNVGGVPYLIEDEKTGFLVAPNDANAMAEKIIELISGELDHLQIIDNARVKVSKYDKQNIIPKWYSIIDKYLNQKNAF